MTSQKCHILFLLLFWFCQTASQSNKKNIKSLVEMFGKTTKGEGTYYGVFPKNLGGACALRYPLAPMYKQKGWIRVAAGYDIYQNSLGCGTCLKIKGNGVGKGLDPMKGPYYGVVIDLCVGCKKAGLDFFTLGDGRWDIEVEAISCPHLSGTNGKAIFRFVGSNPWYLKLQLRNAKVSAASLEVFSRGKWHCLSRVSDNHFVIFGIGKINFPLPVRVRSIFGETIHSKIQKLENDKDLMTNFQFSSTYRSSNWVNKASCYGQGKHW